MKKILVSALAAMSLVACMQEEIMTVPQTDAIAFHGAYVDNATRAAVDPSTTTASISGFDVWAFMNEWDGTVLADEDVKKTGNVWTYANVQYWTPNNQYYFAALAPMNSANVTETLATSNETAKLGLGEIAFTNVDGSEDLLYAATTVTAPDYDQLKLNNMPPVKFEFSHLLSKVKFTFTNGFKTDNAYVEIEDIKMTAPKSGTIDLAVANWWDNDDWTLGTETFPLEFGDVAKLSMGTNDECAQERLTIPAEATQVYDITFTVKLYMGNQLALETEKTSSVTGLAFEMGKAYNFTAEINPENLQLPAIEFEVEVKEWDVVADTPVHVGKTVEVHDAAEFAAALSDPDVAAVVLNNDIELSNAITKAGEAQAVIAKSFVLDGNGKTLTYTGSDRAIDIRSEVENETFKNVTIKNLTLNCTASSVERGINYNANGKLILDNVKLTGTAPTYAVNFPAKADNSVVTINNCELTGLIALNVWGANMYINVENSDLTSVENNATENYAAVKLNNDGGTGVANGTVINIKNSKVTATDENGQPSCAFGNASETGEFVVAEDCEVIGTTLEQIAALYYNNSDQFYSVYSLSDAITEVVSRKADGIRITRDFVVDEPTVVPNGVSILLDLNGKKISATDTNVTGNFYLIDNRGNLTIKDNSAAKTGAITLKANTDRDWNASSVVVANNPGGKLVVDGGLIEHLGGSDMAYGIDNLTNGKGTYAETVINGGTVKSPYRAVRQFLNGIEAQNILTVNGGVIEGANKSIWMQDPSKNANTGKLTVAPAAQLKGDVYLYVTPGSTQWPVEVSIAEAALVEGTVLTGNVPAGYIVTNKGGYWTVADDVKTASNKDELQAAIQNAVGDATIVLAEGTYNLPSIGGKDVTIVGTEETVINTGAANLGAGNLTLDGVTITAGMYQGFQHSGVVTYNNVTVNGELFCYGEKDVFNNCTFKLNNQYVWTYGAENIEFNNCVFETNGKAILVYNEGDGATNVVVKNCTFKATAGAKAGAIANQNCAAIEIDNFQSSGVGAAHNVKTSGNTFDANFSGEWRIKNFVAGNAITVNGTEYTQIAVDGKLMTIDANRNVTVLE